MSVYHELLAFEAMNSILRHMEETVAGAQQEVPVRAVAVLDGVQKILSDELTSDFEKIDEIVTLFCENGLTCGSCHDF